MAIANDVIYNAALTGFVSAATAGRNITSSSSSYAEYVAVVAAAVAFATEVDSLIAEDATISTGGGNASQLAITTSNIASAEQFKGTLMFGLCFAAMSGRYTKDTTAADYATVAGAVVAQYTATLSSITNAA